MAARQVDSRAETLFDGGGSRSHYPAHVRDLAPRDGAHGVGRQRHDGDCLTTQGDELDLVRLAVCMHENNGAEISLAELLLGYVAGENNGVEFLDHGLHHRP